MEAVKHREHHVRGLATAVISVPIKNAWKVASDFYGLAKWVPTISKCYQIRPGVRYAESYPVNGKKSWVEEKLTKFTAHKHTFSYRVVAGNFGLEDYVATMRLDSTCDGGKTVVYWSFVMSKRSKRTKEQQEEYLRGGIQSLEKAAKKYSF